LAPGIINASYLWQDGSSGNNFTVTQSGAYWVKITTQNGCINSDTINVNYVTATSVNLGADTSLCIGDSIQLKTTVAGANYLWSTGQTSQQITVKNGSIYWIRVNNGVCVATDTININFNSNPVVFLGNDTVLCEHQTLMLSANPNSTYLWQDNSTSNNFLVQNAGVYWVAVKQNGCISRDSISINYKPLPFLDLGPDQGVCI